MRRVNWGNLTLAVLGVVTVVLLVLAIQKQNSLSDDAEAAAAAAPLPTQPSVAFVGDGYTSGSPEGGEGPANYTALLGAREGWRVTNSAVYGSGYVAGAPMGDQVGKAADARPDLVVVSGGRADSGQDPPAVRDAAARLYQDLKTRLPQAKVVVVGPIYPGEDAPRDMSEVRDAIQDSAAAAQLPFIDPIEERWFNGRDQDGITATGDNINDRGHQRLSELIDGSLRRANALPRQ